MMEIDKYLANSSMLRIHVEKYSRVAIYRFLSIMMITYVPTNGSRVYTNRHNILHSGVFGDSLFLTRFSYHTIDKEKSGVT